MQLLRVFYLVFFPGYSLGLCLVLVSMPIWPGEFLTIICLQTLICVTGIGPLIRISVMHRLHHNF